MNIATRWSVLGVSLIVALSLAGCGNAQSRKAGYIVQGQKFYQAKNYEKARLEFRNAAQIDPNDAEPHFMLGQIAEMTGDVRAAVGQYLAALGADPRHVAARASLGRLYLLGGLPDKAMELVEPALATDPKNAQLLTVRGAARVQLGDRNAAFEDAKTAVGIAPGDEYAVALLASLYKRNAEFDDAVAVVKAGLEHDPRSVSLRVILADLYQLRKEPAEAEVQLRAIVALDPGVVARRYALARFYLQQKDVDSAERTLRDTVKSVPDSVDSKLQLVQFLAAQRGANQAFAQADQFLSAEPKNDALRMSLGDFLAQSGQPERAERAFQEVIAHAATPADGVAARDRLAALRLGQNDVAAASALIDEVLKQNPRDSDALILRSDMALAHGDNESAIASLRAVLRDQPGAVGIMRTLARAYRQNNEPDLAEETLRNAVQTSPKDFQARFDLAEVLAGAAKQDQAEPLLEQLSKEKPNDISVQEALFRVQAGQKRMSEAMATAQSIQRNNPKSALGYYLAGVIDEANQKPDQARAEYEQAMQREPNAAEPLAAFVHLEVPRKHIEAAMARVNAVIAQSPDNGVARNLKAELLMVQHQTDAAIAAYQKTVEVAPAWDRGYQGLALAQALANRTTDAVATLKLGIDKTHGAPSLVSELGSLYERQNRPDDAIALYEALLAQKPGSAFAANNLAMLLITYRGDATSLARAQKLADQLAGSSEVRLIDTRGWVKFKSGDFHGAESLLQQAVDKAPGSPEMRYHLGMAQLRSGEPQAAEQNLETAVDANRAFVGIDEAKAALAQLKKVGSVG